MSFTVLARFRVRFLRRRPVSRIVEVAEPVRILHNAFRKPPCRPIRFSGRQNLTPFGVKNKLPVIAWG
jgi:hypothetical protein